MSRRAANDTAAGAACRTGTSAAAAAVNSVDGSADGSDAQ